MAQASSADFIRAEGFVFSHVADEGWMDACAGELLRYRRAVGAENILVFTDIKKKHRLELSSIPFRSITRRAKLTEGKYGGRRGEDI